MITQISIRNFRSIASADIEGNWITTFVGSNDAGKSNVLRALNLFFNGETNPGEPFDFAKDFNQFAKGRVQKARQIEIKIRFQLPDSYCRDGFPEQVEWSKAWREEGEVNRLSKRTYQGGKPFPSRSKIPTLMDRLRFTYIPAVKDRAFFADLQGRLYDVLASVAAKPLKASAATFEHQIQTQLGELLSSIEQAFSAEASMKMPENLREIFENLEINSEEIPLSRRGDGIKIRHIPMILKFIAEKRDKLLDRGGVRYTHIWGFEEPENNVEMAAAFDMAKKLFDLIAENDHFQLFLTTHSPIFYRISGLQPQGEDWVTTHFVQKIGKETQIVAKPSDEVDETMGLMPIVAPYVEQAKTRFEEVQRQLVLARQIASKNSPTIFLEGATDKQILTLAWKHFSEHPLDGVHFHDGEEAYGGCNALASRSLAWLLEMRHRGAESRVKAIALFDSDEAGSRAKRELRQDIERLKINHGQYFKAIALPTPHRIVNLKARGFKIPVDLEALYSDEIWRVAHGRNWLCAVEDWAERLEPKLVNKLALGTENPLQKLENKDALRVNFKFTDKGKLSAAKHIAKLSDHQQRKVLAGFDPVISMISNFLFSGQ